MRIGHIPDTPQGRFEMVVLHVVLVVRRLTREGPAGARLARALNEAFIADMDDNMREMTFGDLRVPREIKQVTAALLDRHKAYSDALQDPARPQAAGGRRRAAALSGRTRSNLLLWPWLTTCTGQRPRSIPYQARVCWTEISSGRSPARHQGSRGAALTAMEGRHVWRAHLGSRRSRHSRQRPVDHPPRHSRTSSRPSPARWSSSPAPA